MSSSLEHSIHVHENIMETLVYQEIEQQLRYYPKQIKAHINSVEVATYALNRLPPLYASSCQGKEQQRRTARRQYKKEIQSGVRRALAAIEQDPLRCSTPLVSHSPDAETALRTLEAFLKKHNLLIDTSLSWDNLVSVIQQILYRTAWFNVNFPKTKSAVPLQRKTQHSHSQTPSVWSRR